VEKFKGALLVGALRLFALLPWRAVQAVGSAIGWIMWKTPNRSRDTVRINLSKCFPDMDPAERERLVGRSLMDIGKSLTESACAWIWPAQRSIDLVREVEGLEVLHESPGLGQRRGRYHQPPGQLGGVEPLLLQPVQTDHFLPPAEAQGGG